MEQLVESLRKFRPVLEQLESTHLAELVGLDRAVKAYHDGESSNRPAAIAEYVERSEGKLTKSFLEALTTISALGSENFAVLLRANLPGKAATANPINLAAELYFRQCSLARQLYSGLQSKDGGTTFYCPETAPGWSPDAAALKQFRQELDAQLKSRRQPVLLDITCFQEAGVWFFLLHRVEKVIEAGELREMVGCAVMEFSLAGKLVLRGLPQPWQCINFSCHFGMVFFNTWTFFGTHKHCSLNLLLNHGLSVPAIKSPVCRIITTSAALISSLGVIKEFPVSDDDSFFNVMFRTGGVPGNGYELASITVKVFFPECIGEFRLYPNRIDTRMPGKYLMLLEECLFTHKILTVSAEIAVHKKNFWQQVTFICVQKSMCLDNWRKVLAGCVDFDVFASVFLCPAAGYDYIAGCKNHECGRKCMTDVFRNGDGFLTVCQTDFRRMTPIPSEDVALYEFQIPVFLHLFAEALSLTRTLRKSDELTWLIGTMQNGRKWKCRIGVSFAPEAKLVNILMRMCLESHVPTVMLVPGAGEISSSDSIMMRNHQFHLLSIGDHIVFNEFCRFCVQDSLWREMDGFFKTQTESPLAPVAIRVGPDTKWQDVVIRFKDNHTIVCKVGGSFTTLSYLECGMADLRTGKCDRSWLLLLALAHAKGIWHVDWQNRRKALREQQQKKELCAALKRMFDIDGLPIVYDREKYEYQSLIRLQA